MATIENWTLVEHGPSDFRVHGRIYGNPEREDGTPVRTSAIARYQGCGATRFVVTSSNSVYLLGTPAEPGARVFCFLPGERKPASVLGAA